MPKVRIAIFDTSESESRLKKIVESLAVHGRQISLNGSPNTYVVSYHDSDIDESFRKVRISGSRIIAADYALLVEGTLDREQVKYKLTEMTVPSKKWKRM